MNFFKLYIGDYQRDTAHLSVTEHGAYLLMLQHYYATENPLPIGKALHRMLRAQEKAEREAIDAVVTRFWRETDAGLVNDRADVEITKASAQGETNARIAREREAARKKARETHEQSTNRATKGQPNQTPDTRHQRKEEAHTAAAAAFERAWAAYPKRAGGNSRADALKAFNARIKAGEDVELMIAGAVRYAAFIRAKGDEGGPYVKQAATFFGPGKHYAETWDLPKQQAPAVPKTAFAQQDYTKGLRGEVLGAAG